MKIAIEELYTIYLNHRIISTDSRQIIPGCIFFALKGESFDGNKYAATSISAGADYAVIDDPSMDGDQMLLVKDVLSTLQQLACMHRRKFDIPVIAITGSNGKTTTKELINCVLSRQYIITATLGNFNNHIGVPLTLLNITDKTQIAIIEMGANHQGEIAELCKIAEPTHGLITNIGKAHLGGFGGFEGVIKAKNELNTWLGKSGGIVFVNAGNQLLMSLTTGMSRVLYGNQEGAQTKGKVREGTTNLELDWVSDSGKLEVKTNLVGNYNFENVMAAICIGSYFHVPSTKIISAIHSYQPSNSRSQALKTSRNSIILDAYNANPTSMFLAIENFRQLKSQPKMLILGDMLELGEESLPEHLTIVNQIMAGSFDKVVLVGPAFKEVAKNKFLCFPTSDEVQEWLLQQQLGGYTILIKGSRGIRMEKVLAAL